MNRKPEVSDGVFDKIPDRKVLDSQNVEVGGGETALADNSLSIEAVLFDLDGTLVNTLTGLTQLVNLMRRDFGKSAISEEKVGRYIGKGMLVLVRRAMTDSMDAPLDENTFQLAIKSFTLHAQKGQYDKGTLYPDVIPTLEILRQKGVRIAIVTNKPYDMTLEVLREAGIESLFDTVIGGDSALRPKPAADPILLACSSIGVCAKNALMVGDSGNDSAAAKNAGVPCVLVRTGWSEGIPLDAIAEKDRVWKVIATLSDLLHLKELSFKAFQTASHPESGDAAACSR